MPLDFLFLVGCRYIDTLFKPSRPRSRFYDLLRSLSNQCFPSIPRSGKKLPSAKLIGSREDEVSSSGLLHLDHKIQTGKMPTSRSITLPESELGNLHVWIYWILPFFWEDLFDVFLNCFATFSCFHFCEYKNFNPSVSLSRLPILASRLAR